MATIEDVAKLAGVSVATVSRVLNNSDIVSKEKKEKVLEVASQLNYQPNISGRNLRRSEAKMVLVVCAFVLDDVLLGIQDAAKRLGYDVIVSCTGGIQDVSDSLKFLQNGMVDGVIFMNMIFKAEELSGINKQYPVVQCCEYIDMSNSYFVATNDEKAAYDMVCHLIEQGKKKIAFVAYDGDPNQGTSFSNERERGYRRALIEHGLMANPLYRFSGDICVATGVEIAELCLKMEDRPDAIFCVQDMIAIGCQNALKKAGVKIPEEIAIAGFDNLEICEICDPPLTTIGQPFYEIGKETMNMLVMLIKGEIAVGRRVLIDHKLIVRGSTDATK